MDWESGLMFLQVLPKPSPYLLQQELQDLLSVQEKRRKSRE